jgi:hypothetical protein
MTELLLQAAAREANDFYFHGGAQWHEKSVFLSWSIHSAKLTHFKRIIARKRDEVE